MAQAKTATVIEFGDEVRDVVTGTQGIMTSRTEYITGCDVYGITLPVTKDGKVEVLHFDANRIVLVKKGKVRVSNDTAKGGIFDVPKVRK